VETKVHVVRDADRPRYRLADLLKHIRPGNLHEPVETGAPVGREVLIEPEEAT